MSKSVWPSRLVSPVGVRDPVTGSARAALRTPRRTPGGILARSSWGTLSASDDPAGAAAAAGAACRDRLTRCSAATTEEREIASDSS